MNPSSLLRLSHDVRKMIYEDHLGPRSMSIALLRQTCHIIRLEIECAIVVSNNDGASRPAFCKIIDSYELDCSSIASIESAVGRIETSTIDVEDWDNLFGNALSCSNLQDVERLLEIYAYPGSQIFCCMGCSSTDGFRTNGNFRIGQLVSLASKCDLETIKRIYRRLPCDCAKINFVCDAIKQSSFVVLEGCDTFFWPSSIERMDQMKDSLGRAKHLYRAIGRAVGASGSIQMLDHVQKFMNDKDEMAIHCFVGAAMDNHVHLLKHIEPNPSTQIQALECAIAENKDDATMYLLQDVVLTDQIIYRCLARIANSGDAKLFQRVLSDQSDPAYTSRRDTFLASSSIYGICNSLCGAIHRGDEDVAYFLSFYFDPLYPARRADAMWHSENRQRDLLYCAAKTLSVPRMAFLLQQLTKYVPTNARSVYLDALKNVLEVYFFRPDIADLIMQTLSVLLISQPLNEEECKQLARGSISIEAFKWVVEQFQINILPDDAVDYSVFHSGRNIYRRHSDKAVKTYLARCYALGATLQHGEHVLLDAMSLMMGKPFDPKRDNDDDEIYGGRELHFKEVFQYFFTHASFTVIKRLLASADRSLEWTKIMLRTLECACYPEGLTQSPSSGCYQTQHYRFSLLHVGRMRLYQYACVLLGQTPTDPKNLPPTPDP